jgi:hypothetical protein
MTPQQKIAERIYELLPHKKELEFGCEVLCNKFVYERNIVLYIDDRYLFIKPFGVYKDGNFINKNKTINYSDVDVDIIKVDIRNIDKIIGQPIRLADILLAIEIANKKYISLSQPQISITSNGIIIDDSKNEYSRVTDYEYNLEKDNILDQSDDFCEFLLELLK